ncbi:MAG TPA: lysylphosphatidylglycerol synthase transmembrane domain-containing protein [Caldilineaceae bacterium]|nr:lysylphosphatidylglycerol synthase transmembrane domain-containing protein [Caldilineaceae bacterium]
MDQSNGGTEPALAASGARPKSRLMGWLPGVLASALAIGVLWWLVDWSAVGKALAGVPASTLALAFGIYLVSAGARARCWQLLLPERTGWGRVFVVMQEGYLLNNIFPFRLGELWRALIMGRTLSRPPLAILSTIVIERMYDVVFAATMLLAALPFMVQGERAEMVALICIAGVALLLLALWAVIYFREQWRQWLAPRLVGAPNLARTLYRQVEQVVDGFAVLTNAKQVAASVAWMAVSWVCLVAEYYVLLRALMPQPPIAWALFALGAGMLGGALPSAPSGLGLFEAAIVSALALFGVPLSAALSLAILIHLFHALFSSAVGFWGILREGETVFAVYHRVRNMVAST